MRPERNPGPAAVEGENDDRNRLAVPQSVCDETHRTGADPQEVHPQVDDAVIARREVGEQERSGEKDWKKKKQKV